MVKAHYIVMMKIKVKVKMCLFYFIREGLIIWINYICLPYYLRQTIKFHAHTATNIVNVILKVFGLEETFR